LEVEAVNAEKTRVGMKLLVNVLACCCWSKVAVGLHMTPLEGHGDLRSRLPQRTISALRPKPALAMDAVLARQCNPARETLNWGLCN
jgi:hypothetical protein